MKQTINFLSKEVALAAIEDAVNFGLKAKLVEQDSNIILQYESSLANEIGMMEKEDDDDEDSEDSYSNLKMIISDMQNQLSYQIKWMREDLAFMQKQFSEHLMGHLPAIKDATKMEEALKSLGLAKSFEVRKPSISVDW